MTALPAIATSSAQEARADETNAPASPQQFAGQKVRRNITYNGLNLLRPRGNYLLPHQKSNVNNLSPLTGGDNCPGAPIPVGTYTTAAPFTDSGDTTGANNTVNLLSYYYYYNANVNGPDVVYSFTLTSLGASPQIRVTPASGTYDPSVYILNGRYSPCPSGTGNVAYNWWGYWDGFGPGGAETISLERWPVNTPFYLFIDATASGHGGPYTLSLQDATIASGPRTKFDFDGDRKADLAVYRPSDRVWYLNRSTQGVSREEFGLPTDQLVPADYDGDGKTDIAIFRDGVWWWIESSSNTAKAAQFGLAGDLPVPADYTGDGRADLAVYRGGTWWTYDLANNHVGFAHFGLPTDKTVVGDYDGDGRADQAVFRNGVWYVNRSRDGFLAIQWGLPTDKLIPADFDGDGRTDFAVYRDGTWYLLRSSWGFWAVQFGTAADIPVPADYDGDGFLDFALYRDGNWNIPVNGGTIQQFGLPNDRPLLVP